DFVVVPGKGPCQGGIAVPATQVRIRTRREECLDHIRFCLWILAGEDQSGLSALVQGIHVGTRYRRQQLLHSLQVFLRCSPHQGGFIRIFKGFATASQRDWPSYRNDPRSEEHTS